MPTEFKIPELGENVTGGDVVNVLVGVGDTVQPDQPVLELETDKATIEVPVSVAGTVTQVHVKPGDKVNVGQVVLSLAEEEQAQGDVRPMPDERVNDLVPDMAPDMEMTETPAEAPAAADSGASPGTPDQPGQTAPGEAPGQPVDVSLPELGENIQAGDVVRVLVKVGDTLQPDQPILEIETDKATIEVPAQAGGVITALYVKEGEKVEVGQRILTLEAAGTAPARPAAPPPPAAPEDRPGPAERSAREEGTTRDVTTALSKEERTPPPMDLDIEPEPARGAVPAAPNVRRLAREIGVDITQVPGSGPGQRVAMDDVKAYARRTAAGAISRPVDGRSTISLPDFARWGEIERAAMTNVRRTTADRLSQSWSAVPHVTQFDKADIVELEQLRKRFGERVEAAGGKLTITAILLKIVAAGLKAFPQFNASIDMAGHEIIYKKYYHIGVAVDTDRGLLVPVIRDVDQKNIMELAAELNQVAEKARTKKLGLEDMQGGTFTITNLGGIGGTAFTPIVNAPEVAILGVARGQVEPIYRNNQFEPRLMLPLALSYDHRLIDGADGIRFLRYLVEHLEQPFLTSLQGW